VGITAGIIKKSGAFLSFDAVKLGQGFDAAKTYLKANPKVYDEIAKKVREHIKSPYPDAEK